MKKVIAAILILISMGASAEMQSTDQGYWSLGTSKAWNDTDFDTAFATFIRLMEKYGEQFNFVVQDLHKEGTPKADGAKTAQVLIKIYISPPNSEIERELREVGLVYVPAAIL